jgi:SnoaL-like domain
VDRAAVENWLTRYVEAWRANAPDLVEALFTEDAVYHYRPYGDEHAVVGRSSIVESWLEDQDDPDSWVADYRAFAVDGDRAVAVGTSRYEAEGDVPARTFHNCFLLTFAADGRCSEFTDFYMAEPEAPIDG